MLVAILHHKVTNGAVILIRLIRLFRFCVKVNTDLAKSLQLQSIETLTENDTRSVSANTFSMLAVRPARLTINSAPVLFSTGCPKFL